jgi:hypothetical protein
LGFGFFRFLWQRVLPLLLLPGTTIQHSWSLQQATGHTHHTHHTHKSES